MGVAYLHLVAIFLRYKVNWGHKLHGKLGRVRTLKPILRRFRNVLISVDMAAEL